MHTRFLDVFFRSLIANANIVIDLLLDVKKKLENTWAARIQVTPLVLENIFLFFKHFEHKLELNIDNFRT